MKVPEVISTRVKKLNCYLGQLKSLQNIDLQKFKDDPKIHFTAERCLHLAIESVLDMGNHLIAASGMEEPKDYEDIITTLGKAEVFPPEFAGKVKGLGKFRNILVHAYVELDLDLVYQHLKEIGLLEDLARYIVEYIEAQPGP